MCIGCLAYVLQSRKSNSNGDEANDEKKSNLNKIHFRMGHTFEDVRNKAGRKKIHELIAERYKRKKDKDEDENKGIPSPLESFDVIIENGITFFSNISINIFLIFFFIILFFSYFNNRSIKENIPLINLVNLIFNFFFNTFKNLVPNVRYERYFFLLLSTFVFILFENLGSFYLLELPFTSHAVITLFLSFILFFNYVIIMLINFNELSYKKFVQKNINIFFAFFLFFIELISFLIRPFSLGIRLFANILSGHISVHIFFSAFIFTFKFMF